MSKVAISGNASGTGTFTIAAPNSNTDRTLTLPDEAGTVLTSAATISSVPAMITQGTWTPAADFGTTSPTAGPTTGVGIYQRIGNFVTVSLYISNIDITGAAGNLTITGLPYSVASEADGALDLYYGSAYFNSLNVAGGSAYAAWLEAEEGGDYLRARTNEDNATAGFKDVSHFTDDVTDVRGTVIYYTTDAF